MLSNIGWSPTRGQGHSCTGQKICFVILSHYLLPILDFKICFLSKSGRVSLGGNKQASGWERIDTVPLKFRLLLVLCEDSQRRLNKNKTHYTVFLLGASSSTSSSSLYTTTEQPSSLSPIRISHLSEWEASCQKDQRIDGGTYSTSCFQNSPYGFWHSMGTDYYLKILTQNLLGNTAVKNQWIPCIIHGRGLIQLKKWTWKTQKASCKNVQRKS